MKTYNKLLAMAWMAIHPFCTKVHADQINWEKISHFFNFNTIEEKKRANLTTNIQLLVEEQLKLPSGQNLWKAFQFWEEQHPELGFQFEFTLLETQTAHIKLKKYEESSQIFTFEIICNEIFTNKTFKKQELLNINMLYRPCLIKLAVSDNPSNWEYHLREQKLPFFITLAHEFLHALNQLERIEQYWNSNLVYEYNKTEDLLNTLDDTIFMQDFLANKLKLKNDIGILSNKYLTLWGNKDNDDFLDEMTVILGSKRQIALNKKVFIGETTFLREYYKDKSIISWSHDGAHELRFWERMGLLLGKDYVTQILANSQFGLNKSKVASFYIDDHAGINFEKKEYRNSFEYPAIKKNAKSKIIELIKKKKVGCFFLKDNRRSKEKKIEVIEILKTKKSNVHLLPKCYRSIKLEKHQIVDTSEMNMEVLKKYSIEDADLIAQKLDYPVVIIAENDKEEGSLQYQCLIYTDSKRTKKISINSIEKILDASPEALKLYYDGVQFHAIVKN